MIFHKDIKLVVIFGAAIAVLGLLCCCPQQAFADTANANATLAEIAHELTLIKPLVAKAQNEAPKDSRFYFHYERLNADIDKIIDGINAEFDVNALAPHAIAPIDGDYLTNERGAHATQ